MPRANSATLALNRGILSELALARIDISRYRMAADVMTNFVARVLGSMILRPGWQYLANTYGNLYSRSIPFVFSASDLARCELTGAGLRVLVNDMPIVRNAVATAITNGGFVGSLTGWTVSDDGGCTSSWVSGVGLSQIGSITGSAILDQEVSVSVIDAGVEQAIRITVARGPISLSIGSAQGLDDYFSSDALQTGSFLGTGVHSIAIVPAGAFWIRIENANLNASLVTSVQVEAAGDMVLPLPYAGTDLPNLRYAQSNSVIYLGVPGFQQRKIQRWSTRSWSFVVYEPLTGPFLPINITPISLTPSALTGDITLTASKPYFKAGHVGALFQLASSGQTVTSVISAADTFTDPIRVAGFGSQRTFAEIITGSFVGTLTLQYSVGAPGDWIDTSVTFTGDASTNFPDGLDNQIIYYRLGFKAGDYTSGAATVTLSYTSGSITGVARVTGYVSPTLVNAAVLSFLNVSAEQNALGSTAATVNWNEGAWSTFRGWPSTVVLHEGRLWWFGQTSFGSISDDYENFDPNVVGDSGVIQKSIGEGPAGLIYWALSLQRLLMGTATAEFSVFSSALAEPVTPTDCNIRPSSTQGSAYVDAVRMDKTGIFTQVSTSRLFQLMVDIYTYDYKSEDLTILVPDLNAAGILQIVIQRKPDTRIHCRRADGTVGLVVIDPAENVICWQEIETDGFIEDMSVLPGVAEDQVYYQVARTFGSTTVRFHEKWAQETQCTGLPEACHADAFFSYQSPTGQEATTITVPDYFPNGVSLVVWGWNTINPFTNQDGTARGLNLGPCTVVGRQITLSQAVTNATIGLGYSAQWMSMKQAFVAAMGTALNQYKRASRIGFVLKNTAWAGISMGDDFADLDQIPQSDLDQIPADPSNPGGPMVADTGQVFDDYDETMFEFDDYYQTDNRVCIAAEAPYPCNVLAFTLAQETNEA